MNNMNVAYRKGFSYGLTSGVITTLGLLIGLYYSAAGQDIILAGILTIAFADALSDGFGMHVSEESENRFSVRQIWQSTISTILAKMIFSLSFIVPVVILPLTQALVVGIVWGMALIFILSYWISKHNKIKLRAILLENIGISMLVIAASFLIGRLIN